MTMARSDRRVCAEVGSGRLNQAGLQHKTYRARLCLEVGCGTRDKQVAVGWSTSDCF